MCAYYVLCIIRRMYLLGLLYDRCIGKRWVSLTLAKTRAKACLCPTTWLNVCSRAIEDCTGYRYLDYRTISYKQVSNAFTEYNTSIPSRSMSKVYVYKYLPRPERYRSGTYPYHTILFVTNSTIPWRCVADVNCLILLHLSPVDVTGQPNTRQQQIRNPIGDL